MPGCDSNASLAQQVELLICNEKVAGSIPAGSSKIYNVMIKYTEVVKGCPEVNIVGVTKSTAYYSIMWQDALHQFEVPLEELGATMLLAKDKSLIFARYIRKSIEAGVFVPTK